MADANDELWDAIIECCPDIANTDARADTVFMNICRVLRQGNKLTLKTIRLYAAMANVVLPAVSSASTFPATEESDVSRAAVPSIDSPLDDSLHAWRSDFKGSFDLPLLETLREAAAEPVEEDRTFLYSRQLPIIQSSGTGKSRLVNQVSKTLFAVPICLREVGSSGFPPRDVLVCEYFTEHLPVTRQDANKRCNAFFLSLLIILDQILELPEYATTQKLWQAFEDGMTSQHHGPFRFAFHRQVVELAEKLDKEGLWERKAGNANWHDQECTHEGITLSMADMSKHICSKISKLSSSTFQTSKQDFLLITIDEGNYFNARMFKVQGVSYFSYVCQSLSHLVHSQIVIPVTSTAVGIRDIFPVTQSHAFAEARYSNTRFLDPYTAIGWDVMQKKTEEVNTLSQLETMKCFGRPLFALWNQGNTYNEKASNLVDYAAQKLLFTSKWQVSAQFNKAQYIALAGAQISLARRPTQFSESPPVSKPPYATSEVMVEQQIFSHLAILAQFDPLSRIASVLRPAEPVVALAAIMVILDRFASNNFKILGLYAIICEDYNFDASNRGEVLAMVVCLEAYKYAHNVVPTNKSISAILSLLRPVKLQDYLQKLTSAELVGRYEALHAIHFPDWQAGQPQLRILQFKDTWLALNSVSTQLLCQAFVRGISIRGCPRQYAVDFVVPVLFGDQVCEENMGAIFIQVKNVKRFSGSSVKQVFSKMDELRQMIWPNGSNLPTVHILFSFGTDYKPSQINYKPASNSYYIEIHGRSLKSFPSFTDPHFGGDDQIAHILTASASPTLSTVDAAIQSFLMPCIKSDAAFINPPRDMETD